MGARQRWQWLQAELGKATEITVEDACRLLDVSPATARRDFERLAREGLAVRTWGGIRAADPLPAFALPSDAMPGYRERRGHNTDAKRRIARAAARLVDEGDVLMIDGGTTTAFLAEFLAPRPVKILTNSLVIAQEVDRRRGAARGAEVHLTGGLLFPESNLLVGPQAEAFLRRCHARWAFLSVGGVDGEGLTNHNDLVMAAEQAMIAQSETTVVLADSSKLGRRAMGRLCSFDAIHLLITETATPRSPLLESIAEAGVRILEEP